MLWVSALALDNAYGTIISFMGLLKLFHLPVHVMRSYSYAWIKLSREKIRLEPNVMA